MAVVHARACAEGDGVDGSTLTLAWTTWALHRFRSSETLTFNTASAMAIYDTITFTGLTAPNGYQTAPTGRYKTRTQNVRGPTRLPRTHLRLF